MCSQPMTMSSLLHTTNGANNPPDGRGRKQQHYCSSRCFVVSLLLVLVALVASDVYLRFPNRRNLLLSFSRRPPLLSRSRQQRGDEEGGGCDIFRGEWVPDQDAPYYTNDTCKVIHEHDCMSYGKPDLGFVKWRWRPDGCDLPRFNPWRFLHMMRGKTLAFVGDSLSRNQKDSLICLLTRVAEPTTTSLTSRKNSVSYYGDYNFTVAHFWAPFLVRHEQIDKDGPLHTGVWNLYLDEPDDAWAAHVAELDYVVVSASIWFYRRPSMLYEAGRLIGCYYCKLPNVTDLITPSYALRMATRAALRALSGVGAAGGDGSRRFGGTALMRTVDPSQYEGGPWNNDGNCVRTAPYRRGQNTVEGMERDFRTLQVEEFASAAKAATDSGSKVKMLLMDTTEAMILRADAHPGKYREKRFRHNDCVHWCLPGAIDTWNDMLLHMLK